MRKRVLLFFLLLGLSCTPTVGWLASVLSDRWDSWQFQSTLDLRADQSAIVCAVCAVLGLPILAAVLYKLDKIDRNMRR